MSQGPDNRRELKLTLRTLLAWLDDALAPEEARNIGQKVAESTVARDLVAKIQKVVRRRRLTVPPPTGADAVDPNLVAAYLDNELSPAQVTEFEERCLHNDVLLAEVASAHQILAMVGQKARVPGEAKYRMYHLVRGRESIERAATGAAAPVRTTGRIRPARPVRPDWKALEEPGVDRPAGERLSSLAALAGLVVLMLISGYWLTRPRAPRSPQVEAPAVAVAPPRLQPADPAVVANAPAVVANAPAVVPGVVEGPGNAVANVVESPITAVGEAADLAEVAAVEETPATDETEAGAAAPASMLVRDRPGIVLRTTAGDPKHELLAPGASLGLNDRVLGLAPFRTGLAIGPVAIDLIGPTEVQLLGAKPEETARLDLLQGRMAIHAPANAAVKVAVLCGVHTLVVDTPAGGTMGFTRIDEQAEGHPASGQSLAISNLTGEASLECRGQRRALAAGASIRLQPDSTFSEPPTVPEPVPVWLTANEPSQADALLGQEFAKYFQSDRTVRQALGEALAAEDTEMQRLALSALGSIGQVDAILPLLTQDDADPGVVRTAIAVLREFSARSPESAQELGAELEVFGGHDWSVMMGKLLLGFTAEEARSIATYRQLIKLLEDPSLGVRILAIDTLTHLSRRDPLGYDPSNPTEPAPLAAWEKLLQDGDLAPVTESKTDAGAVPKPNATKGASSPKADTPRAGNPRAR